MRVDEALPFLAEQLIGRHPAVVEEHLAGLAGAHAELVFLLARRHARRAVLDDERRDALRPGGAIGDRHDDHDVADAAVRRERLRAVQHPAVADRAPPSCACRRRRCRRSIRSAPGADLLAARQRHEIRLLLRLGAEHGRCAPSTGRCARPPTARRRDRRAPALRCRCSSRSADMPAPPYSSGNWMPSRPSAGELRNQLDRKVLRLVPLADVRADLGFGELAHAAPEQLLLFGQPEVHRPTY